MYVNIWIMAVFYLFLDVFFIIICFCQYVQQSFTTETQVIELKNWEREIKALAGMKPSSPGPKWTLS